MLAEKPAPATRNGDVTFTADRLRALVESIAHDLGGTPEEVLARIDRGELPDDLAAMQLKALYRLLHG